MTDFTPWQPSAPSTALVTLNPATSARNVIQPSADVVAVTVKGKVGQTADLQQWQDSAGAVVGSVSPGGLVRASGVLITPRVFADKYYNNFAVGSYLDLSGLDEAVIVGQSDNVTLAVRAAPGQSLAVQEWRDSDSNALASITAEGQHRFIAANEQVTVGAAGAITLPGAAGPGPVKLLKVVSSTGALLVIPAYAAA